MRVRTLMMASGYINAALVPEWLAREVGFASWSIRLGVKTVAWRFSLVGVGSYRKAIGFLIGLGNRSHVTCPRRA